MKHDELFWDKVDTSGGHNSCWEWQGYINHHRGNYGQVNRNKKPHRTHRYAWQQVNGEIPEDLLICHKCDNPKCCNPSHLFLGTHKDNTRDMMNKGRDKFSENAIIRNKKLCGILHNRSKLSEEDVLKIRERIKRGIPDTHIAKDYPVMYSTIRDIRVGITWKHLK